MQIRINETENNIDIILFIFLFFFSSSDELRSWDEYIFKNKNYLAPKYNAFVGQDSMQMLHRWQSPRSFFPSMILLTEGQGD